MIEYPETFFVPFAFWLSGGRHQEKEYLTSTVVSSNIQNMTAKQRKRAIMSESTQRRENSMCREALAVTNDLIGSAFWTKRELQLSESEGRYERRMVEQVLNAATRRRDHIAE
jgi:hypothetical protein